jgi:hypothetical protein
LGLGLGLGFGLFEIEHARIGGMQLGEHLVRVRLRVRVRVRLRLRLRLRDRPRLRHRVRLGSVGSVQLGDEHLPAEGVPLAWNRFRGRLTLTLPLPLPLPLTSRPARRASSCRPSQ